MGAQQPRTLEGEPKKPMGSVAQLMNPPEELGSLDEGLTPQHPLKLQKAPEIPMQSLPFSLGNRKDASANIHRNTGGRRGKTSQAFEI